jgi:hypothetical protein
MPWVIRDVVKDINKAVARRWQELDPLLPEPSDLPEGCMAPLLSIGDIINWPARDVTGVPALLRHGLRPVTVIAVRPKARHAAASPADKPRPGLVFRPASPR